MAKSHLKLVSPTTVNRTVATPLRRPNAELRTREYLTDAEVERLTEAAKAQPVRPPRRHHGVAGLQAWPEGRRSLLTCVGTRLTSITRRWPSAGPRRAHPAPIPSGATNCGHCAG